MIGYFDASALAKRYVEENHSREVADLLSASIAVTCRLSESEIASALARRCREGGLSLAARNRLLSAVQRDMKSLWVVEISPEVSAAACRLLMRHQLRAGDALQLAAALVLARKPKIEIRFVCFDRLLNTAAMQEGLALAGVGRTS